MCFTTFRKTKSVKSCNNLPTVVWGLKSDLNLNWEVLFKYSVTRPLDKPEHQKYRFLTDWLKVEFSIQNTLQLKMLLIISKALYFDYERFQIPTFIPGFYEDWLEDLIKDYLQNNVAYHL